MILTVTNPSWHKKNMTSLLASWAKRGLLLSYHSVSYSNHIISYVAKRYAVHDIACDDSRTTSTSPRAMIPTVKQPTTRQIKWTDFTELLDQKGAGFATDT